jgi:glutathione reductase (NADPH)
LAGGPERSVELDAVPSVVFTTPPLAAVGLALDEPRADLVVNQGDSSRWASARRTGQEHAAYKVIQEARSGRILGAHVLGDGAADLINIFTLAIRRGLTGADLRAVPWAYPTSTSDLKYMVVESVG